MWECDVAFRIVGYRMLWIILAAALLLVAVLFLCYAASVEDNHWLLRRRVVLGRDRTPSRG